MSLFVLFLIVHGVLGGLDVVVNHEMIVHLPKRPGSKAEQRLHAAREAIFATLFLAIVWWEWHGAWVLFPAGLLLAELLVSMRDAAIEGETRILPVTESVLHVALFVNLGALFAFGGQQLRAWAALPAAVTPAAPDWPAWALSAMAVLAMAWAIRDAVSAQRECRSAARYSQWARKETLQ